MKKITIKTLTTSKTLYIEETPAQGQKIADIFSYDNYEFLQRNFDENLNNVIITVDEGNGAISLFVAKSKTGSGYLKRSLESGQHAVGRLFHIASPIYFIKNPIQGTGNSGRYIAYLSTSDIKRCMFFPSPVDVLQAYINGFTPVDESAKWGKGIGVAGKNLFYQTIAFQPDTDKIDGLTRVEVTNANTYGGALKEYIGGVYEIL